MWGDTGKLAEEMVQHWVALLGEEQWGGVLAAQVLLSS